MNAINAQRDFSRQARVFSQERRRQTCVAELGASPVCRYASTFIKAGGAAAGISIWSSYTGPQKSSDHCHWLLGPHAAMIKAIAGDGALLDFLDPSGFGIEEDLAAIVARYRFPWLVLHIHDPEKACEMASHVALCGIELPVLLTLEGPSGVLVERTTPSAAVRRLESLRGAPPLVAGPCVELDMLGAGAVLSEIMLGDPAVAAPRTSLFYSLRQRRRIDCPANASLADLVAEISMPIERATFCGRRGVQVGTGGLGTWTAIAIALDQDDTDIDGVASKHLLLFDGDSDISPSNANRQILFSGHIGEGPKATIAADALRQIDPRGMYEGRFQAVKDVSDLDGDAEFLFAMPDNNETRLLCGDAAWNNAIVMATAATSASTGYSAVQEPARACLRCVTRLDDSSSPTAERESCSTLEDDAIVATNMVCGALAVSELREALSGRPATNLSFYGTNHSSNSLGRRVSNPACPHRANVGRQNAALVR